MSNALRDFMHHKMVLLPQGEETIRKYRDETKWISSNYGMSILSSGKNQSETIEKCDITAFYMSKYPVTNELYDSIMQSSDANNAYAKYPKVNISWVDTIKFCNVISATDH